MSEHFSVVIIHVSPVCITYNTYLHTLVKEIYYKNILDVGMEKEQKQEFGW